MLITEVEALVRDFASTVPGLLKALTYPITARDADQLVPVRFALHAAGGDEPVVLARLAGGPHGEHTVAIVSDVAGRWVIDFTARRYDPAAQVPIIAPAAGYLAAWESCRYQDLADVDDALLETLRGDAWPYDPPGRVAELLLGLARRRRLPVQTVPLVGPYATVL